MERAARQGIAPYRELWHMTPRELELGIAAQRDQNARRLEEADLLAWLAGGYAALALRAPKRYPKRPAGVRAQTEMSDAEMERALRGFAARRKGEVNDGDDA